MLEVFIVDDDPELSSILVEAIEMLGYRVRAALDGETALARIEEMPADIVLSDWNMPHMSGLELCVTLKAREPAPYVIMITASDDTSRLVEGMRAGADDFIRKPIALEELEVRLLAASRLINALHELSEKNARLKQDSDHLFQTARTDPLTGIGNRLALDEDLARLLSNSLRYGRQSAVSIFDIDFFKRYNDRYGHLAGDEALRKVSTAVRNALRTGDALYRYGGEEFVVALPEQSGGEAMLAIERIRRTVQALGIPHPGFSATGTLTISAGIACVDGTTSVEQWLARADAALYRAKAAGRNRVMLSEREDSVPHSGHAQGL